ncbi:MAG: DUF1631 family protein [Luteimonas sp.]
MDRNDLLSATLAEYRRGFSKSVDRALMLSADALFDKTNSSYSTTDQMRFLDARGILLDRDADLRLQLHRNMDQLLSRSMETSYSTFRPSFFSSLRAGKLTLVDSSLFEDELRIGDMTNRFRNAAEEPLRDLNIRIAYLFEQDAIKERENPFRPYLLSRSIAMAVESLGVSADLTGVLLAELGENMEPLVAAIYDDVNTLLAHNGIAAQLQMAARRPTVKVEPASPEKADEKATALAGPGTMATFHDGGADRVPAAASTRTVEQLLEMVRDMAATTSGDTIAPAPTDQRPGQRGGAHQRPFQRQEQYGDEGSARNSGYAGGSNDGDGASSRDARDDAPLTSTGIATGSWLGGTLMVGEALRKFFLGESGGGLAGNTQRSATMRLAASVDQLISEQAPAGAQMGDVRNLLLEQRVSLNSMTDNVGEKMTIDIVAMLFEFILRDPLVPAEVRAQLGRLQFLVLKIALFDTSLLTQKQHPVRLLLNRIGSISVGVIQADPRGERITAEVCRIVEILLRDGRGSGDQFSSMLDEFDAFIENELRVGDVNVERAVHLAKQAQSRTLRFMDATAKMNVALAGLPVDPFLHDFFVNVWVHVLAISGQTDADTAHSFKLLVPDLLWSIAPKVSKQDRLDLFALLPGILGTLREGLAMLEQAEERQQSLLNWLVNAHTKALRSRKKDLPALSLSSFHRHFDQFINAQVADLPEVDCVNPDKYRQFLDESIKKRDFQIQLLDSVFDHAEGVPVDDNARGAAPLPVLPVESSARVMERLRSGIAIAITLGEERSLGRLNWIDANAANIVLTLDGQITPSLISVHLFLHLYQSGRVSFLEATPLFERALASLLESADRMD